MRMVSSPLMTQSYNSHSSPYNTNVPIYNPDAAPGTGISGNNINGGHVTVNPIMFTSPVDGKLSPLNLTVSDGSSGGNHLSVAGGIYDHSVDYRVNQASSDRIESTNSIQQNSQSSQQHQNSNQAAASNHHLSRLITAERDLAMRLEHEAEVMKRGGAGATLTSNR